MKSIDPPLFGSFVSLHLKMGINMPLPNHEELRYLVEKKRNQRNINNWNFSFLELLFVPFSILGKRMHRR